MSEQAITLHRADLKIDIRNLISYAVGCILGGTITKPGITYKCRQSCFYSKYDSNTYNCPPTGSDLSYQSKQSIVPICSSDQSKLGGDLTSLFINWLRAYGTSTLSENLQFIAYGLTRNKCPSCRQTYHQTLFSARILCRSSKMYRKRPIYWLFDSGRRQLLKDDVYSSFSKTHFPFYVINIC